MVIAFKPCLYLGRIILLHCDWINLSGSLLASKCRAFIRCFALSFVVVISRKNTPNKITVLDFCYDNGCPKQLFVFQIYSFSQFCVAGGKASVVNANTAFMGVIVFGLFLSIEPATWIRVVGVIIGVTGVAMAIGVAVIYLWRTPTIYSWGVWQIS